MKLNKRFPVQIDGEPFEQCPATLDISFFNRKNMLEKIEIQEESSEWDD